MQDPYDLNGIALDAVEKNVGLDVGAAKIRGDLWTGPPHLRKLRECLPFLIERCGETFGHGRRVLLEILENGLQVGL